MPSCPSTSKRLADGVSLVVDVSAPAGAAAASSQTLRDYLQTQRAELLRLSALLETGITHGGEGQGFFTRAPLGPLDLHALLRGV
ncbi:hypothetical protein FJT64_004070 [Amphibalanus amphitrite]|uniref:Uncharacterized protein n=1 Tax=Amphibalanus amphitrite TaxID=1232801 RepID=A0A6A4W479_AMPAM|nr:hypothetical protein FJT64_004070 [Amphibalanus amphitrite]